MNQSLAALLISRIENAGLLWLDKVAGLTRPITSKHPGTGQPRTWPISCGVLDPLACDEGTIRDLLPDEKYMSILFIEGETFPRREQDRVLGVKYVSDLRIVVWLNCAKVASGCGCGDHAARDLIRAIEGRKYATGPFREIKHTVTGGGPARGTSIFGKYTFDEAKSQYLHYPFDFFALDVRTEFRLLPGCEENLDPTSTECWTPPPGPPRKWPRQLTCEDLTDPENGLTAEQIGPDCLDCGGSGPCDPLTWTLKNSDDETLETGDVTDPCGAVLPIVAPDGTAILNGVSTPVPSGGTVTLPLPACDDLVDAIVVEGAGTEDANGIYVLTVRTDTYVEFTSTKEGSEHVLSWGIAPSEDLPRIVRLEDGDTPYVASIQPSTTSASEAAGIVWEVFDGVAPAPTVRQATIADRCPCPPSEPCLLTVNITVNGEAETPIEDVDPCVENTINININ